MEIKSITRLADVVVPEVFAPYVIKRTMEKSALVRSGIISNLAEFDSLAAGPSTTVNLPYWDDLIGESETIVDVGWLTPERIIARLDVATKHGRGKAWGANGLSAQMSGDDPMEAIGNLVAEYWQREYQKVLLATLEGVFASNTMSDKIHDITDKSKEDSLISGASFIDAMQKMGDAKENLSGIMMHSAVEAYLAKRELIDYVQEAGQSPRVPVFMNKRVIVDDGMPFDTATNTGTSYIFGQGAVALGNGSHPRIVNYEVMRDHLASSGEDVLITRQIFILHPRGIRWTSDRIKGEFPSFDEMRNGQNWERVYEPKAVRIVKFVFKTK